MFAGISVVALVVGGVMVLSLYWSVKRSAQNVEAISGVVLESVARPLSNIPTLVELGRSVVGWVQEYRSRQGRDEDDDA